MKKSTRILSTFAVSAACICAFSLCAQADISVSNSGFSLKTENDNWKEISDRDTLHTFTNGTDMITVLRYRQEDELPGPEDTGDEYEGFYQTIYYTEGEGYVATGFAVHAEDIVNVRKIIDGIAYSENPDVAENSGIREGNISQKQESSGEKDTGNTDSQSTVNDLPEQGEDLPQAEADNSSDGTDEPGELPGISDPYDLFSWDAGTDSYIPYQQAEGSGLPIGRGNGWYYYDEASGSYLPW